jgi:DNA-binding beta-propeller fold protein YncE
VRVGTGLPPTGNASNEERRGHCNQPVVPLTHPTRYLSAQSKRFRTFAGTGTAGSSQDDVDGGQAPVNNPYGVVFGPDGALYFCEVDTGRIRRFDVRSRRVTTIAGNGQKGYAGDGGPAQAASLSAPHEIRFDANGNLYAVERDSHVVRRIDARTKTISTVAGTGSPGFSGDGGPATRAELRMPHSIAFDAGGNLLICDIANSRIRSVNVKTGTIGTFAGTGDRRPTPDEGPLEGTTLNGPRSIDTDEDGNVYLVLREGNAVFRIDRRLGRLARIAGTGETGYSGDGGPALAARFNGPKGIAYAPDRSLYIVDTENHAIRRVDLASGSITTVLGTGRRGDGPDGDPLRCTMARPHGVCLKGGAVYVTDSENHRIRVLE